MIKASENLKRGKALIIDPSNWIKKNFEKDENGESVCFSKKPVCKFCAIGAYQRAALTHFGVSLTDYNWSVSKEQNPEFQTMMEGSSRYIALAMESLDLFFYQSLADYNDRPETTHEDILKLYDKAIELAEREESNA